MSKLIKAKIDVSKIDKTKLFRGQKGTYLDVDVWIDEDEPEEWKQVSLVQSQSKEDRENKIPKNYIGNGELKWGWDTGSRESANAMEPKTEVSKAPAESAEEIPF